MLLAISLHRVTRFLRRGGALIVVEIGGLPGLRIVFAPYAAGVFNRSEPRARRRAFFGGCLGRQAFFPFRHLECGLALAKRAVLFLV
jgi:hypothetical protein